MIPATLPVFRFGHWSGQSLNLRLVTIAPGAPTLVRYWFIIRHDQAQQPGARCVKISKGALKKKIAKKQVFFFVMGMYWYILGMGAGMEYRVSDPVVIGPHHAEIYHLKLHVLFLKGMYMPWRLFTGVVFRTR